MRSQKLFACNICEYETNNESLFISHEHVWWCETFHNPKYREVKND